MFGKNKLNFIYVSANVRSSAMCLCVCFIHKSCLNSGFNNISFTHLSPGLENIQIPCLFQDFQAHECSVYVTITSTLFKKSFWLLWLLGSAVFFVTHPWGVMSSHHPRTDLQMTTHPCDVLSSMLTSTCWLTSVSAGLAVRPLWCHSGPRAPLLFLCIKSDSRKILGDHSKVLLELEKHIKSSVIYQACVRAHVL